MLDVKMKNVMIRERDLSDAAKQAHSAGAKLCKGEKTQKFAKREAVTASYGNITVCAPDARSARMGLAEKLRSKPQSLKMLCEIAKMVNQHTP